MIPFNGATLRTEGDEVYLTLRTSRQHEAKLAQMIFDARSHPMICAEFDLVDGKERQKRSRDANAYAWVLLDKLAAKMGRKKEDVYRDEIRDVGGNSDVLCMVEKAARRFIENWGRESNGRRKIGWYCETSESKLPGCVNITAYYGSSVFDTAQMQRFIDNIVQDCQAVGIETLPPDKLNALLTEWGKTDAKE